MHEAQDNQHTHAIWVRLTRACSGRTQRLNDNSKLYTAAEAQAVRQTVKVEHKMNTNYLSEGIFL